MGGKKLKIKEPIIQSFGHQSAVYCILSAYPETESWLNCNYIQIFTLHNLHTAMKRLGTIDFYYQYYGDFNLYEMKANPWFKFMSIPNEMVGGKWNCRLDFIKECMNRDYYVYMVLNRSVYRHNKKPFYHNVLLWGYDDSEKIVYAADNNSIGKFAFEEIHYEDFEIAANVPANEYGLGDHGGRTDGIYFFSVVVDKNKHIAGTNHMMQIGKLQHDLEQYLNPFWILPDYSYGIECYEELKKYYRSIAKNDYDDCDWRGLCSLLDHKVLMTRRLEYLFYNGYIAGNYKKTYYENVEKKCFQLRNILVKEVVKRCKDFHAERLCELLDEMRNKEVEILSKVNDELKSYLNAHIHEYREYYMDWEC